MNTNRGSTILRYGLLAIVVFMPFHAFFTTWLGANLGHLLAIRAWKEVVLAALTGLGLYYFITDNKLRQILWRRTINKAILVYGSWLLLASLLHTQPLAALSQGLAIDFRFLVIFVLFQIAVFYQPISRDTLYKIVLIPSVGVVLFGVLQMLVLPREFLTWFGYNKYKTIPPYFTVDEQLTHLRYASTLSGPNTLGAYLLLPMMMVIDKIRVLYAKKKSYVLYALFFVLLSVVLYASQSRSAWLAALTSGAVYIFFMLPKKRAYKLLAASAVFLLLAGAAGYHYRESSFVANTLLHNNPTTGGIVDSNEGHVAAVRSGLEDVKKEPLVGCGVGCAGPASVRTDQPKISENYYLQIAQESGVVGLGLLITVIILVSKELYKKRADSLALALFSTLIGLSICNLLLHTWADDTLSLIWWSVAAMTLYTPTQKR